MAPSNSSYGCSPAFLGLLLETRLPIYNLLLAKTGSIYWPGFVPPPPIGSPEFISSFQPQLLRLCHQVHDEALPILYGQNTFHIPALNQLPLASIDGPLSKISVPNLQQIRRLRLYRAAADRLVGILYKTHGPSAALMKGLRSCELVPAPDTSPSPGGLLNIHSVYARPSYTFICLQCVAPSHENLELLLAEGDGDGDTVDVVTNTTRFRLVANREKARPREWVAANFRDRKNFALSKLLEAKRLKQANGE